MRTVPGARSGFSLLDVALAATLLALVSFTALAHVATMRGQSQLHHDRVFAYERAQSILDELRAFAETGESREAALLDAFDDGNGFSHSLTTLKKAPPFENEFLDPESPVSGNGMRDGEWAYARRVTVRQFPGLDTRDLRIVTVRVFGNSKDTDPPGTELANLSTVVRTVSEAQPPTQVYDVYLLALENVPGWWVFMDTIKPFVETTLDDLASRNPGLEFRTHWITKQSYGRNPQYTPFFNEAAPSTDPIDSVYFYPSRMPDGSAAFRYYVPDNVRGRVNVDGIVRNGFDVDANPWPYALADQYNHAMRLPEEEALFAARVASGAEREDEPTYRLLLERMNSDPESFRNAIIVNLHGELIPMPPLRNYSDAAREPEGHPGVRVVTHPERLHFVRGADTASSDDVRLRVYTYRTQEGVGPELLGAPVVMEIPGLDLTGNVQGAGGGPMSLEIRRIPGGVDVAPVDGARDPYQSPSSAAGLAPVVVGNGPYSPFPGEMYARVRYVDPGGGTPAATVIELYGSPVVAPAVGAQGLTVASRLYGMEYVPCSTEAANDFSVDLSTDGPIEKNTARWVVTIPAEMLGNADRRVAVHTRIGLGDGGATQPDGAAFSTGIMYPPEARLQPENLSRTYCWWTDTPDDVPFTERSQFQGDPRHCPYADLKAGGVSFPDGYNWYFDDFQEGSNNAIGRWPGFDAGRIKNNGNANDDGWERRLELDLPRMFDLLRHGLTTSEALFTTLTGFSYYYVGVGNEIGYDSANGFPDSIPVSGQPFGQTGDGFEQAITNSGGDYGGGIKYVRSSQGGDYWWGMTWLGELYPDSAYADSWRVPRYEYSDTLPLPSVLPPPRGNLPAGSAATAFRRVPRDQVTTHLPFGTRLRQAQRRTNAEGCTSVFNIGTSGSTFHHQYRSGTYGDLTPAGDEVASEFNFPLPDTTKVSRPFELDTNFHGGIGDEFNFTANYPRYSAEIRKTYYDHSSGATGSALVELTQPGPGSSGYVLVNGIDRTTESGSSFISRYAMLTLIHGFLSSGEPSLPTPIPLRPRTVLTSPTAVDELADPATIEITWSIDWRRWDGRPYTQDFPVDYSEAEDQLEYVLLYTADNGDTWRHVIDDSPATPGVRPDDDLLRLDDLNIDDDESFTWDTPAGAFPEGSYTVRVETYRIGRQLHYSWHEEKVFINR